MNGTRRTPTSEENDKSMERLKDAMRSSLRRDPALIHDLVVVSSFCRGEPATPVELLRQYGFSEEEAKGLASCSGYKEAKDRYAKSGS